MRKKTSRVSPLVKIVSQVECHYYHDCNLLSTETICDDMCKTIIATALLLSFIISILLSSYFIHRYHKNSPKPPIASAEMTFRRPAQAYPISFPANNLRRGSQESIETDTFKIPVSFFFLSDLSWATRLIPLKSQHD